MIARESPLLDKVRMANEKATLRWARRVSMRQAETRHQRLMDMERSRIEAVGDMNRRANP